MCSTYMKVSSREVVATFGFDATIKLWDRLWILHLYILILNKMCCTYMKMSSGEVVATLGCIVPWYCGTGGLGCITCIIVSEYNVLLQCVAVCCSVLQCVGLYNLHSFSWYDELNIHENILRGCGGNIFDATLYCGTPPFYCGVWCHPFIVGPAARAAYSSPIFHDMCRKKIICHWWYVLKKNKNKFVPFYCGMGGLGCIFLICVFDNMCWTYMNIHEHTWTYMNIHELVIRGGGGNVWVWWHP